MQYIGIVSGSGQENEANSTNPENEKEKEKWRSPSSIMYKNLFDFGNKTTRPKSASFTHALTWAHYTGLTLPWQIRLLRLVDVFRENNPDIWNKSPGLPWRYKGFKTNRDIRKNHRSIAKVRSFWNQINSNDDLCAADCLLHVPKEQKSDTGKKNAGLVWEYPATMTFGEAMFAIPLVEAYKKSSLVFAYDYNEARGGMKEIANRFDDYDCFTVLHFKDFHETVPTWLVRVAFDLLFLNVDIDTYADREATNAVHMLRMWNYIVEYFINTTIRTTDGMIFKKSTGIPGDSLFTQLITSVINIILCQWICQDQTGAMATDILVRDHTALIATDSVLRPYNASNLLDSIGIQIDKEKSQSTKDFYKLKYPFID